MNALTSNRRMVWLVAGLLAGLGATYFWPQEPAYANTADRDKSFALITVPVGMSAAGINDPLEGVFVLDFLTGKLQGAVLHRTAGQFAAFYERDLQKDFELKRGADPRFAIASGYAGLAGQQNVTFASGIIYIAELNTGKLRAYAFPYREANGKQQFDMVFLDQLQWRQAVK